MEDAILLPPNAAPILGRPGIVTFLKELRGKSGAGVFTVIDSYTEGNLAYIVGEAEFPSIDLHCSTLEAYRKQADGSWKCVADMFHSQKAA